MRTIIDADTARLAGLQIDTLQKVRKQQVTLDQWQGFNNLSAKEREILFGDPKRLKKILKEAFAPAVKTDVEVGQKSSDFNWVGVYNMLGMQDAFQDFEFEEKDNLWTVPVIKGVTPSKILAVFRNLGVNVYSYYNDIDVSVPKNDRDANRDGSYAVSFKKNIEADPEFAGKSANDLARMEVKGITLLERLLLELAYFLQTNQHLDVQNVTLCSGSRLSDGDVPDVRWDADGRGLYVRWFNPSHSNSSLRARAVVS